MRSTLLTLLISSLGFGCLSGIPATSKAGVPERHEAQLLLIEAYEDAGPYCEMYPRSIYETRIGGIDFRVYCDRRDMVLADLRDAIRAYDQRESAD